MPRLTFVGTFVALVVASVSLYGQSASVAADLNGPHVVLRSLQDHDWSDITIELNSYWTFKVPHVPKAKTLCVNDSAFTVKASIQGGRDFTGIYFDPSTMKVKTVEVRTLAGTVMPLSSVTSGMIKPLTPEEVVMCVGSIHP